MPTEGERLATVETLLHELRDDSREIKDELKRSRGRLHKVEGAVGLLLNRDKVRADIARDRNKKNDRAIQLLIGLAAFGAIIVPLLTHFIGGS